MARKYSRGGSARNRKKSVEKKVYPEFEGRVQMTREGYAFIIIDGEEDDVFVKASKTRGALNGDIVRVVVKREKTENQRREGEVMDILQRSQKPFIGILHVVGEQAWVLMQNRFMPYDISIPFAEPDESKYRRHKVHTKQSLAEPKDERGFLKLAGDGLYTIQGMAFTDDDGVRHELQARMGMKVAVVVDGWKRGDATPTGHIVDVLGDPGENDTEMHAILAEYGLPYRFEPEVSNAADSISDEITEKDLAERRDFRDVLTLTIDPADAKDFDDALSFRKLENGNFEVGVHIADVTHYVQPKSVVDEEARKRGTSVYLVDRTVPMLPEKLSNKLCSLRPNEDKLTFSAVFELTPRARVAAQWFGRTVIRSNYRFAYETAQQIIDNGEKSMEMDLRGGSDGLEMPGASVKGPQNTEKCTEKDEKSTGNKDVRHDDAAMMGGGIHEGTLIPDELKEAVLTLNSLASKLRKKRFSSGAISFERPEMKVIVDDKGRPVDVYQKMTKEANWLIEEFMLLANRSVAEFVATGCKGTPGSTAGTHKRAKTFVYRIHDEPNQDKIENLRKFIGNFGYKMGPANNGKEISKELNGLFEEAEGTPEYNAIELLALRTMAKARYTIENVGHYGLAFKYYTHFTSPIRRYPDMMVHRLLAKYLAGGESAKADTYESLCKYASEREIVAADAERSSIKYKLVEFMQDKVGMEYEGHISGLTDWGMYVEVEPTKIEGMIALRDIKSDFFEFNADRYRLEGRRSKVVYNLGDPVRIRVKNANLEQKLLDYELVETGLEERRKEYESNRGASYVKGADGSADYGDIVGANKAARKEKVRQAIRDSKRKAKAAARKGRKAASRKAEAPKTAEAPKKVQASVKPADKPAIKPAKPAKPATKPAKPAKPAKATKPAAPKTAKPARTARKPKASKASEE